MSRILMRDVQKEVLRGRVCLMIYLFSEYFSAFASLFVFLKDQTRIDAAKPKGV